MIKATCPCGGTFETATNYYSDDRKNVFEWLALHQACVNERVVEQALANKKYDWPSGFDFEENKK